MIVKNTTALIANFGLAQPLDHQCRDSATVTIRSTVPLLFGYKPDEVGQTGNHHLVIFFDKIVVALDQISFCPPYDARCIAEYWMSC